MDSGGIVLPDATGADAFPPMPLVYPIAIVVTVVLGRRNTNVCIR